MKYIAIAIIVSLLAVFFLSGCRQQSGKTSSYKEISKEEAVKIMEEKQDYIILDVRTREEYASGHIPVAICIPNETIGTGEIAELQDKEQLILVYCRSGNRSRQASQKLADMGYTNIMDFGGINSWTGEIEK